MNTQAGTQTHEITLDRAIAAVRMVIEHGLAHRSSEFEFDHMVVVNTRTTLTQDRLEVLPGLTTEIMDAYLDVQRAPDEVIYEALDAVTGVFGQLSQAMEIVADFARTKPWTSLHSVRDFLGREFRGLPRGLVDLQLCVMARRGEIELAAHDGQLTDDVRRAAMVVDGQEVHKLRFPR